MKSQEYQGSGRRRGGRRSRNRDSEPRSNHNNNGNDSNRPVYQPRASAPVKKSFWQKLVAFFKPESKPSNGAAPRSERSRSTSSNPTPAAAPRISRKPEAVEVTSAKLYVGNLSYDTAESDLTELFNGVGSVVSSEIVTHKATERSKGFGFVTMTSIDEARRAVLELHDKEFMGRKLVVSGAKTPA